MLIEDLREDQVFAMVTVGETKEDELDVMFNDKGETRFDIAHPGGKSVKILQVKPNKIRVHRL